MVVAAVQATPASSPPVWVLPGTNFAITSKFLRVTLTTAQATLAAGDLLWINQIIEGIRLRELINDVHSVSLLVRSSVANLSFGMALRDLPTGPTRSLTKLCTIPSAGVWTLIPLPNLPIWPTAGSFALGPGGSGGYTISLTLASGTTFTSPANDTWQNGNFVAALGQSNFAASPVNSTFDVAFVQHEPGAVCNPLIDLPWEENLNNCKRYWSKNYAYAVAVGTASAWQQLGQFSSGTTGRLGVQFPREMAKTPTVTAYGVGGGINQLYIDGFGDMAISSIGATGIGLNSATFSASQVAGANNAPILGNYTASTGW
jgi:hypothetical protein